MPTSASPAVERISDGRCRATDSIVKLRPVPAKEWARLEYNTIFLVTNLAQLPGTLLSHTGADPLHEAFQMNSSY